MKYPGILQGDISLWRSFFFLTADVKIRSILPPDKLYSTLYFHVTSTNAKGVNKYDLITVENDTRVWPIYFGT